MADLIESLKAACRKEVAVYAQKAKHWLSGGDYAAVRIGALTPAIAEQAGMRLDDFRRELKRLEIEGKVIASRKGTTHRWWPVGFVEELQKEQAQ